MGQPSSLRSRGTAPHPAPAQGRADGAHLGEHPLGVRGVGVVGHRVHGVAQRGARPDRGADERTAVRRLPADEDARRRVGAADRRARGQQQVGVAGRVGAAAPEVQGVRLVPDLPAADRPGRDLGMLDPEAAAGPVAPDERRGVGGEVADAPGRRRRGQRAGHGGGPLRAVGDERLPADAVTREVQRDLVGAPPHVGVLAVHGRRRLAPVPVGVRPRGGDALGRRRRQGVGGARRGVGTLEDLGRVDREELPADLVAGRGRGRRPGAGGCRSAAGAGTVPRAATGVAGARSPAATAGTAGEAAASRRRAGDAAGDRAGHVGDAAGGAGNVGARDRAGRAMLRSPGRAGSGGRRRSAAEREQHREHDEEATGGGQRAGRHGGRGPERRRWPGGAHRRRRAAS